MSLLKEVVSSDVSNRLLLEVGVEPAVAKEMVHIGSALSGASLAAAWASLGTAATAASVKGLLLAAGFTNPVTLTALGVAAAGGIAAATVIAGGKIAYTLSKDATRGVFNPSESQRLAADLLDVVKKRDKALAKNHPKDVIRITNKMQEVAKNLHDAAIRDLKKEAIDKKTYHMYMSLSKKGVLGRLSTLV